MLYNIVNSVVSTAVAWRKKFNLEKLKSQRKRVVIKQKSYKCDNRLITWLTGITRPAGSCNLVTLKINFAQYKNFV